jgi:outer membrane immunogenic protein
MIRPQLLAATALSSTIGFLVPGVALAAPPALDWSGFYAGMGLGLSKSDAEVDFSNIQSPVFFTAPQSVKLPVVAPNGGVRLGYNWQAGQFVYGLEADGEVLSLDATATGTSYTITNSLNALLSLRARFGMTYDRVMVFGSVGAAAGASNFVSDVGNGNFRSPATGHGIVTGYVVGLGAEYALTDTVRLTASAQYYALGSLHGTGVSDNGYSTPYAANVAPRGAIFETGINVHF